MWPMVAAVGVAITVVAVAYNVGTGAGHSNGKIAGYTTGYDAGINVANLHHAAAIDKLNQQAAEQQLAIVTEQDKTNRERQRQIEDARVVAATELARIDGDRDRLAKRVQSLLRVAAATGAGSHQGGGGAVPGLATAPGRDGAAQTTGLLLDRIGTNLAGLAGDADKTLAQYAICSRYAYSLKSLKSHADAEVD